MSLVVGQTSSGKLLSANQLDKTNLPLTHKGYNTLVAGTGNQSYFSHHLALSEASLPIKGYLSAGPIILQSLFSAFPTLQETGCLDPFLDLSSFKICRCGVPEFPCQL